MKKFSIYFFLSISISIFLILNCSKATAQKKDANIQQILMLHPNATKNLQKSMDAVEAVFWKYQSRLKEYFITENDPRYKILDELVTQSNFIRKKIFDMEKYFLNLEKPQTNNPQTLTNPMAVYHYQTIFSDYNFQYDLGNYENMLNSRYIWVTSKKYDFINDSTTYADLWKTEFSNQPVWVVLDALDALLQDITTTELELLAMMIIKYAPAASLHGMHDHDMKMEVKNKQNPPTIQLKIEPDMMDGWNLQIQTQNFKFTPENVGKHSMDAEGHAHLYINGQKIARIYSNWYHLEGLPSGKHIIRITLNTNHHGTFTWNGKNIESEIELVVP
jgi:hypothetical protein